VRRCKAEKSRVAKSANCRSSGSLGQVNSGETQLQVVRIEIDPKIVSTLITVTENGNADRITGIDTTLTVPSPHVIITAAAENRNRIQHHPRTRRTRTPQRPPTKKLHAIKRVSRRLYVVEHTHTEVIGAM